MNCSWRRCTRSVHRLNCLKRALLPLPQLKRRRYLTTVDVSAKEWKFGQAVHETHPHLIKAGHVTPEISAQEYHDRRQALADTLPADSVALIPSSYLKYRSGPVFHPFHQDANFFYLTGFNEPNSVAVIDNRHSSPLFTLFVREKDERAEQWEGPRSGTVAARDVFNADNALDVANITDYLPNLLKGAQTVYTDLPLRSKAAFEQFLFGETVSQYASSLPADGIGAILKTLQDNATKIKGVTDPIAKLRLIKSRSEIKAMRIAGQTAGRAHTNVMKQNWQDEMGIRAALISQMMLSNCENEAYVPVVAGGQNALCIHYVQNNSTIQPQDMVLVDAGAQYGGYISDVTRTWPVSGQFSEAQKDLYSMVLQVQRVCVSLCHQDSNLSLDSVHKVAEKTLRQGLKELGFDVSGNAMDILYPHHTGHYIGLDVHDTPSISRGQKFQKDMCVTIEPGVYVPNEERWPKQFRGMGIRIEDSICIDDTCPYVLTTEAVKEMVDIEALRN